MKQNLVRLGDVAEIQRESVSPASIREGIPYIGLEHIDSSGAIEAVRVAAGELASSKFQFSSQHVLYGKLRPYLRKIARPSFSGICSTDVIPIRPGPRIARDYLFHVLRQDALVAKAASLATGINLPRISPKILESFEIPLPSLDEQRRIAAVLDQAEDLRRKRRQTLERLSVLTQSLFIESFGDPAVHSSNYKPLGEYLRFITSGGRGWAKFYSAKGSRFIRSLDVQMNRLGNEEVVFVKPPDNAEAHRTRVNAGDVLLTITGSRIGRVAPVPEDLGVAYISQHVAILRLDENAILPVFLAFFLSLASGGQRQIAKAQYGQTKPGLNFEQIKRFQIPAPPIVEQKRFCEHVAQIARVEALLNASYDHFDALFSSLQDRAFRGELMTASAERQLASLAAAG